MHSFNILLAVLFAASSAAAQTLPPSPTASVGCEPHGDHWHCDGPASSTITSVTASSSQNQGGTGTLAPSPTESIGCHPHGDHWHCEGPASTTASPTNSAASDDHDDHDEGTGTLAPSPTESIGCEPHGDHWHCDGPAAAASTSSSMSSDQPVATGGAGKVRMGGVAIVGGLLAAAGMDL
ncbi:hypothetical protein F4677DRAFT_120765 [Hypoxylon crocopeplum]|nr:hypothetical protein F4677DRAFT_120765 [Hypoxylon crocopeplum]